MSRTTVAGVVVDGLRRAGTPRLFGVRGEAASLPLLEAARAGGLPLTLAAGATAACVMAAVTGDLTDAPGAVLLAGEPGAASAVGIAHARRDRAPMVLLTSEHPAALAGCKETLGVEVESAAHRIAHAVRLAMTEPRGPVHLDVAGGAAARPAVPLATSCRPDPRPYPDRAALDAAARALGGATRPLLLAGIHCRSAASAQWLKALAEALPAPLLATARAKGALPDPHPLMLGVLGGGGAEERLLARADLVVALGLDTLEQVPRSCPSTVPVLGLGPAPALAGRAPAVEVSGDVDAIIEELAPRLRDKALADWDVAELERMRREGAAPRGGDGLVARVVRLAREATPAGTIATLDAGPHHALVALLWLAVAPREFLTSSVPATTGFALPAAIAAHLVHRDRRVVGFTDGAGLAATAGELETAARLAAPIVLVVFGDGAPGPADPVALAKRVGVTAVTIHDEHAFGDALGRSLLTARPALIAVQP